MLPKTNKINKKLFDKVFKEGKTYHSDFLYIKTLKNNGVSKFSFVVMKKNLAGAVRRNLIKRRGFSIIKQELTNIKSGVAVIFFIKKGSEKITFKQLETEIKKILSKANLLRFHKNG